MMTLVIYFKKTVLSFLTAVIAMFLHSSLMAANPENNVVTEGNNQKSEAVISLKIDKIPAKNVQNIQHIAQRYYKESPAYLSRIQSRGIPIFPVIDSIFRQQGLPSDLKYLAVIESGLNPQAKSPAGATGLWQFIYNTAKEYNLKMSGGVDERKDIEKSTLAAALYLKKWHNYFGDWLLAIAAYNCGPRKVIEAQKLAGQKNFWAIREYLPLETQCYVPIFLGVRACFQTYTIAAEEGHGITKDKSGYLLITKPSNLKSLSKNLGVKWEDITILNPTITNSIVRGEALPLRLYLPEDWWAIQYESSTNKYIKAIARDFYNNGGEDFITELNKGIYFSWNPDYLASHGRYMWNGVYNEHLSSDRSITSVTSSIQMRSPQQIFTFSTLSSSTLSMVSHAGTFIHEGMIRRQKAAYILDGLTKNSPEPISGEVAIKASTTIPRGVSLEPAHYLRPKYLG